MPFLTSQFLDFSATYGHINMYDKSYDRINTRNEKLLQHIDRAKYDYTTSDDPVMQQVKIGFATHPHFLTATNNAILSVHARKQGNCLRYRFHSCSIDVRSSHCLPLGYRHHQS